MRRRARPLPGQKAALFQDALRGGCSKAHGRTPCGIEDQSGVCITVISNTERAEVKCDTSIEVADSVVASIYGHPAKAGINIMK